MKKVTIEIPASSFPTIFAALKTYGDIHSAKRERADKLAMHIDMELNGLEGCLFKKESNEASAKV